MITPVPRQILSLSGTGGLDLALPAELAFSVAATMAGGAFCLYALAACMPGDSVAATDLAMIMHCGCRMP